MLILLACMSSQPDCLMIDDITERWWEITSPEGISDSCYLFTDDGLLIEERPDGTKVFLTTWTTEDEECLRLISSPDGDLEVTGAEQGGCVLVSHEGVDLTLCEC